MTIDMLLSPIILTISNKDYNLLMKCINHNVSYDDGYDQIVVHDFWKNMKN